MSSFRNSCLRSPFIFHGLDLIEFLIVAKNYRHCDENDDVHLKWVAVSRAKQNDTGDKDCFVWKRWIRAKSRRLYSDHSRVFQRWYVSDFHPLSGKTKTRGNHFYLYNFSFFSIFLFLPNLWELIYTGSPRCNACNCKLATATS